MKQYLGLFLVLLLVGTHAATITAETPSLVNRLQTLLTAKQTQVSSHMGNYCGGADSMNEGNTYCSNLYGAGMYCMGNCCEGHCWGDDSQ